VREARRLINLVAEHERILAEKRAQVRIADLKIAMLRAALVAIRAENTARRAALRAAEKPGEGT
jgi:hypothetical protein